MDTIMLRHPTDHTKQRSLGRQQVAEIEPLLVDVLEDGKLVYDLPTIEEMRKWRDADVGRLDSGVRRLIKPHIYHVSITARLWDLKQELIEQATHQSQ
jgi:nicotinate phosphoribosyltransferase